MTATDELRRLLDERGVEYETDDRNGLRETIWCGTAVFQLSPTAKMTMIVTPEQAIAATLGSDRESELQSALNKAAGNWAKADDRLREALDFMRIWISDDAHLGESELSAAFEKAEGLRKLDAIESAIAATLGGGYVSQDRFDELAEAYDKMADQSARLAEELNATLGGTCEMRRYSNALGSIDEWQCSKCGADVKGLADDTPPKYCPNCGCKVVGE